MNIISVQCFIKSIGQMFEKSVGECFKKIKVLTVDNNHLIDCFDSNNPAKLNCEEA